MLLLLVRLAKATAAVFQIQTNTVKGHIHAGLLVDQRSCSERKQLHQPRDCRESQSTRSAASDLRQQNDIGNRDVDFDDAMGLEGRLVPHVPPLDVSVASTSSMNDQKGLLTFSRLQVPAG
jgi:hypothetical protein